MKGRVLILIVIVAAVLAACSAHGGGWIDSITSAGKATFGFGINCTQIDANTVQLTGQVQYNDHPADVKFHGEIDQTFTQAAEISCDDPFGVSPATLIGTYRMQSTGKTGGFTWTVTDYGEPGPSEGDRLLVRLYDGPAFQSQPFYINGGEIGGGNIQVRP